MRLILFLLLISTFCEAQTNYYGTPRQRNLFFEGNSLMNHQINSGGIGGQYVPTSVYNNVKTSYTLVFNSYAISGRNQTQINASISTNIAPFIKYRDIIILWEGTNDMYTNGLTGQQAYDNLATYVNTVRGYGAIVIVCTVIARDYALDAADLMTRIGDYNTLVRNNASSLGITVCDLAADPLFDARADASNTTYYNADKIHQATAGQNAVITLITSTLTTVLSAETVPMYPENNELDKILIVISIIGVGYYLSRQKEPQYKIAA
jgi:hypothetical protein